MNSFLQGILFMLARSVLKMEILHDKFRELAKKTDTTLDDEAVEKMIELMKSIADKV